MLIKYIMIFLDISKGYVTGNILWILEIFNSSANSVSTLHGSFNSREYSFPGTKRRVIMFMCGYRYRYLRAIWRV